MPNEKVRAMLDYITRGDEQIAGVIFKTVTTEKLETVKNSKRMAVASKIFNRKD